jgi:hypothetical protein
MVEREITIPLTKTIINMKDMIKVFREVYKEDRKEFWESIIGSIFVVGFGIFLYWFVGTFCYDM